ncbi:hypothetical protein ABW19_dt0210509 [Dactylella cylindrospora]|nr:hypothetical protein ABW19_dt0210509 [Dactylella cylindrospora]
MWQPTKLLVGLSFLATINNHAQVLAWYGIFAKDVEDGPATDMSLLHEKGVKCQNIANVRPNKASFRFINIVNLPFDDDKIEALGFWLKDGECIVAPDIIIRYAKGSNLDGAYLVDLGGRRVGQGLGLSRHYGYFSPLTKDDKWFREYISADLDEIYSSQFTSTGQRNPDTDKGLPPLYVISNIRTGTVEYHTLGAPPYVQYYPLSFVNEDDPQRSNELAIKLLRSTTADQIKNKKEYSIGTAEKDLRDVPRLEWLEKQLQKSGYEAYKGDAEEKWELDEDFIDKELRSKVLNNNRLCLIPKNQMNFDPTRPRKIRDRVEEQGSPDRGEEERFEQRQFLCLQQQGKMHPTQMMSFREFSNSRPTSANPVRDFLEYTRSNSGKEAKAIATKGQIGLMNQSPQNQQDRGTTTAGWDNKPQTSPNTNEFDDVADTQQKGIQDLMHLFPNYHNYYQPGQDPLPKYWASSALVGDSDNNQVESQNEPGQATFSSNNDNTAQAPNVEQNERKPGDITNSPMASKNSPAFIEIESDDDEKEQILVQNDRMVTEDTVNTRSRLQPDAPQIEIESDEDETISLALNGQGRMLVENTGEKQVESADLANNQEAAKQEPRTEGRQLAANWRPRFSSTKNPIMIIDDNDEINDAPSASRSQLTFATDLNSDALEQIPANEEGPSTPKFGGGQEKSVPKKQRVSRFSFNPPIPTDNQAVILPSAQNRISSVNWNTQSDRATMSQSGSKSITLEDTENASDRIDENADESTDTSSLRRSARDGTPTTSQSVNDMGNLSRITKLFPQLRGGKPKIARKSTKGRPPSYDENY